MPTAASTRVTSSVTGVSAAELHATRLIASR
jgi:hypothetical protein